MSDKRELVQEELEEIAKENNGVLLPGAVVEYAKDEDTELHSHFEWDDDKAGHNYRLWQARQLIVRYNVILPDDKEKEREVQMWISLPSDRLNGGGYRYTVDVLSEESRRKELLGEAHRQFKFWQRKYKELTELSPVFEAMDRVMEEPVAVELPEMAEAA